MTPEAHELRQELETRNTRELVGVAMAIAFALPLAPACGGETPTQVVVTLEASDAVQSMATRLAVSVYTQEGDVANRTIAALGTEVSLPATVPVIPRDGDASRTFRLQAALLDASDRAISVISAEEAFEEGVLREVTLTFPDERRYDTDPGLSVAVPDFSTSATGETEVPGSTLSVDTATGENWLVFTTARLRAPGGVNDVDLAVVIDGEVRAYGEAITSSGQPYQTLNVLSGDGDAHTIQLRVRVATEREIRVEDASIHAVRVPDFADFHFAELSGEQLVGSIWEQVLTLDFAPVYPGDYVVFGSVGITEAPGGSTVRARLDTPSGQFPRSSELSFGREPVLSQLIARVEPLADETASFSWSGEAGTMSALHNPVLAVMRADAFAAVASALETEAVRTSGTETLSSLELVPPAAGTHWLTVSEALVRSVNDGMRGLIGVSYRRDGAVIADRPQSTISDGTQSMNAHVGVFAADATTTLDSQVRPLDTTMAVMAIESSIVALRL